MRNKGDSDVPEPLPGRGIACNGKEVSDKIAAGPSATCLLFIVREDLPVPLEHLLRSSLLLLPVSVAHVPSER